MSTSAVGRVLAEFSPDATSTWADRYREAKDLDDRATLKQLHDPSLMPGLDRAAERIAELVRMTGGGAFVLTTSVRSMRGLHQRLAPGG
jgi:Rad3-related DNA helicase